MNTSEPNRQPSSPESDRYHAELNETMHRATSELVLPLRLHAVLPDNICTCGHPFCLHPGKHGQKSHTETEQNYTSSLVCGILPLPIAFGNIGLSAERCVILNIDGYTNGMSTLRRLFPQFNVPSDTWTIRTPGGGLHIRFRLPEGKQLQGSHLFIGPGLSILSGPKVYGIAPPSVGLNGVPYSWASGPDVGIAAVPDYLLSAIEEADAREQKQWFLPVPHAESARRIHSDYCKKFGPVGYELFAETWDKVATFLDQQHSRPESFIHSIRSSGHMEHLMPEDLLSPIVLGIRQKYISTYWPKAVAYLWQTAIAYIQRIGSGGTVAELRRDYTGGRCSLYHCDFLAMGMLESYGFPAGSFAGQLSPWYPVDAALEELDKCDLLGQHLKDQFFVHPEELRCRLALIKERRK